MPESSIDPCPKCGAVRIEGSAACKCGYGFFAQSTNQAAGAYPRGSYVPAGPSVADRIIPTKNPKALIAYYCGVFAIVPCFSPILGPAALILGILGIGECKRNPMLPGKGHAITGIVLGSIMTALSLLVIGLVVYGLMSRPR